ncbi:hypothetical protein PRNP1_007872 [Phytophthora ramorum]
MKNARLLRTTEMEKDDDLDSEDEERLGFSSIAKWFNPAEKVVAAAAAKKLQPQQVAKLSKLDDVKPSYLNNPLLKPEGEVLKKAQKFEAQLMAQLSKTDKALLEKIKKTPGAAERISRWKQAEWNPTDLAKLIKTSNPSRFKPNAPEKQAWDIYAAMVLRRDFRTPHGTKSGEDDEGIYTLYFSSQLSDSYTPNCPCHNDRKNKS